MATNIPPRAWEQRKNEILRLYLDEELPLRLVMKAMRAQDFDPTYVEPHCLSSKDLRSKCRNVMTDGKQPVHPNTEPSSRSGNIANRATAAKPSVWRRA